jgi:phage repressor protein C with HTH and peptisase S24 domain
MDKNDMVRKLIQDRLAELEMSRKELSLAIGCDGGYISQFLVRGVPRELHEPERLKIAEILKVPEEKLRGPSSPLPKRTYVKNEDTARESLIDIKPPPNDTVGEAPPNQKQQFIQSAQLYVNMDLPVYGTAQGGEGSLVISDRPVDYVTRPSVLARVQDGYGMIVDGDSMYPALKAGWIALINPHLPPRSEDICIFRWHAQDGTVNAMVKEYRGQTETHWKVRQHNPARDFTLKKSQWQICHRVVGSYFS